MNETNNVLTHFFSSEKFLDYRKLCMQFFDKKVDKTVFGYENFMNLIGIETINEATKNSQKIYPADGRFYQLLTWRYALILKEMPTIVLKDNFNYYADNKVKSWTPHFEAEDNKSEEEPFSNRILLERIVQLTSNLLVQLEEGKFKAKQISVLFFKITKHLKITHFLGLPIDEFACIKEAKALNKQKRNYHNKRFRFLLHDSGNKQIFKPQPDQNGIKIFRTGNVYRRKATELERLDLTKDIFAFFKCFLNYLTASFYFKEALKVEPNLFLAKYNYAYVIKRLGFINEAISELNSFDLDGLKDQEKIIVLENLGDCYCIAAKHKINNNLNQCEINFLLNKALENFEKAFQIAPHDAQLVFNLTEVYFLMDVQEENTSNQELVSLYKNKFKNLRINKTTEIIALFDNITKYYNKKKLLTNNILK